MHVEFKEQRSGWPEGSNKGELWTSLKKLWSPVETDDCSSRCYPRTEHSKRLAHKHLITSKSELMYTGSFTKPWGTPLSYTFCLFYTITYFVSIPLIYKIAASWLSAGSFHSHNISATLPVWAGRCLLCTHPWQESPQRGSIPHSHSTLEFEPRVLLFALLHSTCKICQIWFLFFLFFTKKQHNRLAQNTDWRSKGTSQYMHHF